MRGSAGARRETRGSRCKALACRAYRLASPEGWRLLHALFLLLAVDARLRLTGFARLQKALRLPPGAAPAAWLPETQFREAQRMAQAIRRAARYVPRAHCLHQSLALLAWLRRRGVAAELCIGVQSSGQAVEGHAWIEWRGIPLDEDRSICDAFGRLEECKGMHFPNRPPSG